MSIKVDPEGNEIRALKQACEWRGKRVIEIGCGNGRLTLRLAGLGPESIQAIDPSREMVQAARERLPQKYAEIIRYKVGSAQDLRYPGGSFGLAVFSWVL
jgi:ubiquinone/menaquinone biosynthesis C-methylase UbiE